MSLSLVVLLSVVAELFEAAWQRADTLEGVVEKAWRYYRRSVFLFLAMHTGYLYTLYISLRYDLLNWPIIGILAFKSLDIFFKIELIGRLHGRAPLRPPMREMLQTPIPAWYFLAGAVSYPYFIYLAFVS